MKVFSEIEETFPSPVFEYCLPVVKCYKLYKEDIVAKIVGFRCLNVLSNMIV